MKSWKDQYRKELNRRVLRYLDEYFKSRGIKNPKPRHIANISHEDMIDSWLSIPSVKELLLFQQEFKKRGEKSK